MRLPVLKRPGATILLLFASAVAMAPAARAQVVEFDPPAEIRVDASRVVVTFQDTVRVQSALRVADDAGAEVLEQRFRPAVVWALLAEQPEPAALWGLKDDPRVRGITVLPPSATQDVWVTPGDGTRVRSDLTRHALKTLVRQSVSPEDAIEIVRTRFPKALLRVEKSPNELTLRLGTDGDEIVSSLEVHPLVKYVTYLSADWQSDD